MNTYTVLALIFKLELSKFMLVAVRHQGRYNKDHVMLSMIVDKDIKRLIYTYSHHAFTL